MNRKSTTDFPTSYRWNGYVTPKSPQRVAQKAIVFKLKFNFNRIVCYQVSLCANFQQHSCSITIPLYNGP